MNFIIERPQDDIELHVPTPKTYFYRFLCMTTRQSYVGRTGNPIQRINQHMEGKGSPGLLSAIVEYGRTDFIIELLDTSNCDNPVLDIIEDYYITKNAALHPEGFNLRMNTPIVPNNTYIDLDEFTVDCKYVFSNGYSVFTCGEFTQAQSYQICANIVAQRDIPIKKKKNHRFNYYELSVVSDDEYIPNKIYQLKLKYNMITNEIHLRS